MYRFGKRWGLKVKLGLSSGWFSTRGVVEIWLDLFLNDHSGGQVTHDLGHRLEVQGQCEAIFFE